MYSQYIDDGHQIRQTLTLPLGKSEGDEMEPIAGMRAFLLEDDDTIRNMMSEILAARGYEVYAFANPAICPLQVEPECRCSAKQACTDIIISDLDMPNMTGLDFIDNQKEKNCKCQHVALMSGGWEEQDLSRAQDLGCKTFAKPFSFQEFYEWLDEVEKAIEPSRELANWFQGEGSTSEK
jgi:CheY-like chemotaxis protein